MQETKPSNPHFLAMSGSSRISVQERLRKGNAEEQRNRGSASRLGYMTLHKNGKMSILHMSVPPTAWGGRDRAPRDSQPPSSHQLISHEWPCHPQPLLPSWSPQTTPAGSCRPPSQGCARKGEQVGLRTTTAGTWEPGVKGTEKVRTV